MQRKQTPVDPETVTNLNRAKDVIPVAVLGERLKAHSVIHAVCRPLSNQDVYESTCKTHHSTCPAQRMVQNLQSMMALMFRNAQLCLNGEARDWGQVDFFSVPLYLAKKTSLSAEVTLLVTTPNLQRRQELWALNGQQLTVARIRERLSQVLADEDAKEEGEAPVPAPRRRGGGAGAGPRRAKKEEHGLSKPTKIRLAKLILTMNAFEMCDLMMNVGNDRSLVDIEGVLKDTRNEGPYLYLHSTQSNVATFFPIYAGVPNESGQRIKSSVLFSLPNALSIAFNRVRGGIATMSMRVIRSVAELLNVVFYGDQRILPSDAPIRRLAEERALKLRNNEDVSGIQRQINESVHKYHELVRAYESKASGVFLRAGVAPLPNFKELTDEARDLMTDWGLTYGNSVLTVRMVIPDLKTNVILERNSHADTIVKPALATRLATRYVNKTTYEEYHQFRTGAVNALVGMWNAGYSTNMPECADMFTRLVSIVAPREGLNVPFPSLARFAAFDMPPVDHLLAYFIEWAEPLKFGPNTKQVAALAMSMITSCVLLPTDPLAVVILSGHHGAGKTESLRQLDMYLHNRSGNIISSSTRNADVRGTNTLLPTISDEHNVTDTKDPTGYSNMAMVICTDILLRHGDGVHYSASKDVAASKATMAEQVKNRAIVNTIENKWTGEKTFRVQTDQTHSGAGVFATTNIPPSIQPRQDSAIIDRLIEGTFANTGNTQARTVVMSRLPKLPPPMSIKPEHPTMQVLAALTTFMAHIRAGGGFNPPQSEFDLMCVDELVAQLTEPGANSRNVIYGEEEKGEEGDEIPLHALEHDKMQIERLRANVSRANVLMNYFADRLSNGESADMKKHATRHVDLREIVAVLNKGMSPISVKYRSGSNVVGQRDLRRMFQVMETMRFMSAMTSAFVFNLNGCSYSHGNFVDCAEDMEHAYSFELEHVLKGLNFNRFSDVRIRESQLAMLALFIREWTARPQEVLIDDKFMVCIPKFFTQLDPATKTLKPIASMKDRIHHFLDQLQLVYPRSGFDTLTKCFPFLFTLISARNSNRPFLNSYNFTVLETSDLQFDFRLILFGDAAKAFNNSFCVGPAMRTLTFNPHITVNPLTGEFDMSLTEVHFAARYPSPAPASGLFSGPVTFARMFRRSDDGDNESYANMSLGGEDLHQRHHHQSRKRPVESSDDEGDVEEKKRGRYDRAVFVPNGHVFGPVVASSQQQLPDAAIELLEMMRESKNVEAVGAFRIISARQTNMIQAPLVRSSSRGPDAVSIARSWMNVYLTRIPAASRPAFNNKVTQVFHNLAAAHQRSVTRVDEDTFPEAERQAKMMATVAAGTNVDCMFAEGQIHFLPPSPKPHQPFPPVYCNEEYQREINHRCSNAANAMCAAELYKQDRLLVDLNMLGEERKFHHSIEFGYDYKTEEDIEEKLDALWCSASNKRKNLNLQAQINSMTKILSPLLEFMAAFETDDGQLYMKMEFPPTSVKSHDIGPCTVYSTDESPSLQQVTAPVLRSLFVQMMGLFFKYLRLLCTMTRRRAPLVDEDVCMFEATRFGIHFCTSLVKRASVLLMTSPQLHLEEEICAEYDRIVQRWVKEVIVDTLEDRKERLALVSQAEDLETCLKSVNMNMDAYQRAMFIPGPEDFPMSHDRVVHLFSLFSPQQFVPRLSGHDEAAVEEFEIPEVDPID